MASTEQDIAVGIDEIFKNATQSIADAEAFLNKAKPGIEKAKASKEGRSKLVSKASEVVNALLEPASRVADLLKFVGNFYQPCSAAGNVLQGIVDIETGRRDSDIRVGIIYLEFSTTLIQLGCLKPGFQHVRSLQGPLEDLLSGVKSLMEEFGQFCESFYEGKGLKNKLKHYMHFKPNAEKLTDFSTRLASLKTNLNLLLTHQGVLIASANATTLRGIEEKIDKLSHFFAELKDEPEAVAEDFIARNGGEDNVLENDALIDQLAKKLNLQLTSSILRAVKEGADESFRQSYERFHLKLTFAIENRIEVSTETIMKELRNGPYELIKDTDMKAVWKGIAPKESNLKRRQFIDVYQFNMTWKQYKVDCKVDREDFWTRSILTKVHYQLAIGDAIDDDASGYISIEEVNEFMQQKPSSWSTPKWVAYWAYGWDADNLEYRDRINKSYNKIQNLSQKDGLKKEKIKEYLDETQANIKKIANSLWSLDDLDAGADTQMKKLQDERRTQIENTMKTRLKTVNFRIEYDSMAAVCGSDRIEATLLPLVSVLLSRHIYLMSQATVKDEDIEEAIYTMNNIVGVVFNRISDLRRIWRRQRQDVDVQIRYYVNGLFQDYYKVCKFSTYLSGFALVLTLVNRNITRSLIQMRKKNIVTGIARTSGAQKMTSRIPVSSTMNQIAALKSRSAQRKPVLYLRAKGPNIEVRQI
ncbi:hypothetical protein GYMLUDRAFT_469088 [Collybiopsis luxurians FD-317 M1]|uniref:EF-hand domain-containing protein n=1 Tax=Collybiopsis luxurians FD-317 M1 TaxID=944289 RepID=A0A0D0BHT7_9AGAR|nr:hypothetical protein GYMLUDRAFT_469088 [Collybiopsis luxurians FD-317 M1]